VIILCDEPKPKEGGLVVSDNHFWKAFEATGSPQFYMMYKNKEKMNSDDERDKRNASL